MKLKEINELKMVKILSTISILLTNLIIISIFLHYYNVKSNLTNPLIPESLFSYAYEPYVKKGVILSIGLLIFMIFKSIKQNLFVVICFVVLMVLNQFIY